MRRPSTARELYAWWEAAMRGERPPVHEGEPHCGWFRTRAVRGGPWIPARVFVEREIDPETGELADDERFVAEVAGQRRDAAAAWVSICRRPISREEYEAMVARRDGDLALLATHARFDLTATPPRPRF